MTTTAHEDQFAPEPHQPPSGQSAADQIAQSPRPLPGIYRNVREAYAAGFEDARATALSILRAQPAAATVPAGERGMPDIAEFGELIDDYQCAQKDGSEDQRARARIALMAAYRAALAANAAPQISDAIFLGCARLGLAGASDEEVLRYVRTAITTQGESHVD